jgi:hypothetical protein
MNYRADAMIRWNKLIKEVTYMNMFLVAAGVATKKVTQVQRSVIAVGSRPEVVSFCCQ